MLSLLKKSADKGSESRTAGWHPNFRNFTELPDTKVVRTSFFVNGVSLVVVLAALLYFVYQEYTLNVLSRQVQEWEAKIEHQQGPSQKAVALYKQFQDEQKKAAEVDEFLRSERLLFTEFLMHLGAMLPRDVAISFLDYSANGVTLRGIVNGEPDQASGIASSFERQLREDTQFKTTFSSATLTTLSRDPQSGRLTFEIIMRLEDQTKKK